MSYPGDEHSRMSGGWPRARSGYWPTGMPGQRNPVRGFPPTPGAPYPEYPVGAVSPPNGVSGDDPRGGGGQLLNYAGGGADTVTADHGGPGATDRPGLVRTPTAVWSTHWGAGPWVPDAGGGSWVGAAGSSHRGRGSGGSKTWTFDEDDPTETWMLRGPEATAMTSRTADPAGAWLGGYAESGTAAQSPAPGVRAGPAGGSGHPPAPRRHQPGRRGRTRRRAGRLGVSSVVAVAVLAVTALAATGVYAVARHRQSAMPAAKPANTVQAPSPSASEKLGKWQHIASRADDPIPLTLAELFPAKVTAGPRTDLRKIQRLNHACRRAVFGSKLKAAVQTGCTQALRASYLSLNGRRMGTIGVLNLATAQAASKLGKIVRAPLEFVQPLRTLQGPARRLGKGTGVVWAVAKGHYLILMWAQYASLHRPSNAHERKVLMQFLNDLYQKTVNQSLTRRMVTGAPLTP